MQTQSMNLWLQGEEGEGGTNGESSVDTYALPCVKQTASGEAAGQCRELSSVLCDDLERWDAGVGEES